MTCKDCIHSSDCASIALHDFDHSHRMWLIDFWGNAEERCKNFQEASSDKSEWCVACGNEIPEGRQVCPNCEKGKGDTDA